MSFVCLQATRCLTCVLLVITVTVCLAVTSVVNRDPDPVLCTPINPQLERAARGTAYPALLDHTVTAQV